jgi:hypothetical protein
MQLLCQFLPFDNTLLRGSFVPISYPRLIGSSSFTRNVSPFLSSEISFGIAAALGNATTQSIMIL